MTQARATDHLSIGEVLSLVQEDFPDVTISKIRFLESQGLIAPERTASGYRKFFESDIDRLRWILRQQRDHFLPLKVIKRMLDQGVDLSDGDQEQTTLFGQEPGQRDAAPERPDAGSAETGSSRSAAHPAVQAARQAGSNGPSARAAAAVADDPVDSPARGPATRDEADAGTDPAAADSPGAAAGPEPSGSPATERASASASSERLEDASTRSADGDRSARERTPRDGEASGHAGSEPGRPTHATPADVVAALQEHPPGVRRRSGAATTAPPAAGGAGASAQRGAVPSLFADRSTGERLSRSELLEAAGIDDELLDGLVRFGLIVAVPLGADPTYDQDAVAVARIGRRCAELGIDPRHLRMYKVAAEREAGVVEQLVAPLVRQRNPDARRQATERVDEVVSMGAELHATLLRRHLGPVVDP